MPTLPKRGLCRYEETVPFPGRAAPLWWRPAPAVRPHDPRLPLYEVFASGCSWRPYEPADPEQDQGRLRRPEQVLKAMYRPARGYMTAEKPRVQTTKSNLGRSFPDAAPVSRPGSIRTIACLTRVGARLASFHSLRGASARPAKAGRTKASVFLSHPYVTSLARPGSSTTRATTRACNRRHPIRPDVRTRVSHGQQNAHRRQPPGRNPGGGAAR